MKNTEIAQVLEDLANGINSDTKLPDTSENLLNSKTVIRALFNGAKLLRSESSTNTDETPAEADIKFYQTNRKYGYFSNFSKFEIVIDSKRYPTVEHYFQAMKFANTQHEEEIRNAESPRLAARMGRQRNRPLREDWEEVKDEIMFTALLAKFSQNPEIGKKLIATGNARIIEHTANDSYWGDGGDGSGKNMLGILLMEVRTKLLENT